MFTWFKVGKDPEKGVIIPLYEPPANLSPAAISFLHSMSTNTKTTTAVIISLAVKKPLKYPKKNHF